ncbi:hypothetical protein V1511DRAFT_497523 [Dipodascopsis uninucleata]
MTKNLRSAKRARIERSELQAKRKKIEAEPDNKLEAEEEEYIYTETEQVPETEEYIANDNSNESDDQIIHDDDETDDNDVSDPFQLHFNNQNDSSLREIINATTKEWKSQKYVKSMKNEINKYTVRIFLPDSRKLHELKGDLNNLNSLKIKTRLQDPFRNLNKKLSRNECGFSYFQQILVQYMFSYQDILFPSRNYRNGTEIRQLYTLHILNHIYKTRDIVLKNNAKISRAQQTDNEPEECRDQGFTRPKVLVLLPTRDSCYHFVQTLIQLSGILEQENMKRFKNDYYATNSLPETRPEDFRKLFSGNHDDNFRIGIKFTRKTIKLFTQFYNSDIIVASPLGLRLAIGDPTDKKRDFDFLSSIEVVIVDQAEALLMQNWDHIQHIFKHLNLIPRESHDCDFGRVRNWYLDNQAKYFRQTIVFSEFVTPEINGLFSNFMNNIEGKVKFHASCNGVLADVGKGLTQSFVRFYCPSPQEDPDRRFKYFTTKVLPSLVRSTSASSGGCIIFIPSYVDFVRIRNYLEQEHQIDKKIGANNFSFCAISEYTPVSDVTRARSLFKDGKYKLMLYTERLHHFRRYEIKGAETILMYGLPNNPKFYVELAMLLLRTLGKNDVDESTISIKALFSKWDVLKLERIVGSSRVTKMCNSIGEVFEFS